jgi:hypothetical protein
MDETTQGSWVMIKMTYRDFTTFKVLCESKGTWRLLSHVRSAVLTENMLRFTGHHDTVYTVDPNAYGLSAVTESIWNTMKTIHPDSVELLENQDWTKFEWMTK